MISMEYLKMIDEINGVLVPLLRNRVKDRTEEQNAEIKRLRDQKILIENELIDTCRPCNAGDWFTATTWGGRNVKGVAIDFKVFKGVVYVDSYYPVVKGVKSSKPAFFSFPYKNFKVVDAV